MRVFIKRGKGCKCRNLSPISNYSSELLFLSKNKMALACLRKIADGYFSIISDGDR